MKRALLSVSDKSGLVDFAAGLKEAGWEIIATGGTYKLLKDSGIEILSISEVTDFPEILDGRVKTLHPKIHGGILARRDMLCHMKTIKDNGIEPIDLVCVNLYPFAQTVASPDVSMEEAIENIDIGGPSMLRSAAKNWKDVAVVCDPEDYGKILEELKAKGNISEETRLKLSAKAFAHTASYDMHIASWMSQKAEVQKKLYLEYGLVQNLRYGENPHQTAAFYAQKEFTSYALPFARQLQGKELSYNNIQDANAALCVLEDFSGPFCAVLKHMNPCGAAVADSIEKAWKAAWEADKVSIYGGIVALNREVSAEIAADMKSIFLELVIAPSFSDEALQLLSSKKNLRLLQVDMSQGKSDSMQYIGVNGGILVQQRDKEVEKLEASMCVTQIVPDAGQLRDLQFAWQIVKHVKSNAIVVVHEGCTVGIGAGQTNRVASAEIALKAAQAAGLTQGLILASDGFLPFDDTVDLAASYGVVSIVQPGGSIRDEDSIAKANELGISMLFTGKRHFKH